ncbi:bifunctional diaminohydroxyphosphoribosylaminopyrimidine deaminase/5-amino-6-(5-phosphoribosylamino)uracil reductase RibD [Paralcaligenes sp. KSB-10]|uniref:bifunctional diaminohydroxyphosphoribosylaminopyrimidine deaminase/5-amino-6-(5-phosphoribosylamino)uracil reductase RibD n=1 Tax=Paralcaligenes sp. KSB-10 TaxID=2901142 RepID=UPI001E61966C|nr:bifunctional diaminohydroxyphosphoribosylaminopyrimidine deaminase/5-amino-6-(5-phosphoribosylamino)uracil reductase RibD [Paralcaligenes sp. KSB-10]UHL62758.1 bifunctional diaminohydroxyphosphoribosylaminopyrimidine deaminase/5-amino-6-(5-phosphoribosylamino)uracil reductase RibD [Paralcaligenes sp. KSB-10]
MNTSTIFDDSYWMRQAIEQGAQVLYLTAPNPRVGCIIVRDGQVLGLGATQAVGGPHAEVMALRDMRRRGHDAADATVYVTLEPCSHYGRTPPCVDALIEARPARVVVAMLDPNPLVAGQGLARLRAAGIAVTTSVCVHEALAINPGFIARMTRKTPWVWLKLAASLDGRSALHNGVSQWITGTQARADGHHWRARSCVVLTGVGTVLADDPQLNVRHVQTDRQPIKAIVDTRFEIPEDARLLDGGRTWVFTCRSDPAKAERLAGRNVQVIELPAVHGPNEALSGVGRTDMPRGGGRVDLAEMMRWMGANEINEVHVEAGSRLNGALLQAQCVDELLVYMAPMLLGDALPMARLPALESLEQAVRFEFFETCMLAPDIRLRARLGERWRALLEAVQPAGVSQGHPE